jgi:site-specific DNA recombinase
MARAIIYTRVSTDEQVDGHSLEFQSRRLIEICSGEGTTVLKVFVEPGVSAKNKDNRPELLAALKLAKKELSQGDYFMTYDTSRFTRNHYEGVGMMMELQNKGVYFRDATRVYTDSPEDRFMFILNSGLAQFDNEVKARATRERMATLAKSGEWQHQAPFGYRRGDKKVGENCLVPVEDEAEVVRFIFTSLAGGRRPAEIAESLDDFEAFKSNPGKAKGNRRLKFVLRIGESLIYSSRQSTKLTSGIVEGNWESLVDCEVFEEVQFMLSGKVRKRSEEPDPYWLKPVLLCGECGGKFTAFATKQGRYHYYECFNCRRERIPVRKAHQELIAMLAHLSLAPDAVASIKLALKTEIGSESKSLEGRKNDLQSTISKTRDKLEPLEDELLTPKNPVLDKPRLVERIKELQDDLRSKESSLENLRTFELIDIERAFEVLDTLLSNLAVVFEQMGPEDKASFVFVLLPEKVTCSRKQLQTPYSLVPTSVLTGFKPTSPEWHPQRDSNPCRHLERLDASWSPSLQNY